MLAFHGRGNTGKPVDSREVAQEAEKAHLAELLLSTRLLRSTGTQSRWEPLRNTVENALEFCLPTASIRFGLLTIPFVTE